MIWFRYIGAQRGHKTYQDDQNNEFRMQSKRLVSEGNTTFGFSTLKNNRVINKNCIQSLL